MSQNSIPPCPQHGATDCPCGRQAAQWLHRPAQEHLATRRALIKKALLGGLTIATLPLLEEEAEANIFRPSVADQKKLGNQAVEEILKKYKEVKDDRARSFRRVGEKLIDSLTQKEKGPWDYSFRVVDSKEVNAFALPGGPMFIHTGLLDRINSADELSAVTAHEVAHVREEHWAKQYESEVKRTLGIELLLGVTRTRGAIADLARVGNSLLSLSYSRKEEDQADDRGLNNMFAAGYDLGGMVDLFETLQKAGGNKNEGPDFMRSHPLTKDRIKRTKDRIERMKNQPPPPRNNGDQDRTSNRDRAPSRERDRYRDPNPDDN